MSTTLRKAFAFVVALVMAIAMIPATFAHADPTTDTGSITINDAVPGQTYSVYQILYLESYNSDAGAYAYKANAAWEDWLKTQTSYVSFDAQGYVTWVGGAAAADVEAFAKLAQEHAASITADATTTAPAADEGKTYSTVTFKNLKLGYYLVDTSLGTLCSLDTTNPAVVMQEKNEVPTNEKTVEEDSTSSYGEKNDANIGQTVNFQSTIIAQKGAQNYVFHDTMSSGLTYTGVTGITLNGTTVDALNGSNYTVVNTGLTDGCTFEVRFTQAFCDTLATGDKIVISYTATLNENAVIAGEGNSNTSKLSYGVSSNTKYTPDSQTKTYTWDVDVFKYTMKGQNEAALAGATFTLSMSDEGTNSIDLISEGNNVYRVAKTGETGTVTAITTDATGKFTIKGLDADTYYLTETAAPAGYNKLAGPVTIDIGENGVVNSTTEKPQGVDEVKVLNQSGTELPSTGGMGTTVFYVVGGILVVGAIVLLVARKRMTAGK